MYRVYGEKCNGLPPQLICTCSTLHQYFEVKNRWSNYFKRIWCKEIEEIKHAINLDDHKKFL